MGWKLRYLYERNMDKFCLWIAGRIPRRLRNWVLADCGAKATTGQYGSTVVPELTFMEAWKRVCP